MEKTVSGTDELMSQWQNRSWRQSRPLLAARFAKRRVLRRIAAGIESFAQGQPTGEVGIFMYHRVANVPTGAEAPTWNVTPAQLQQQLEGLRSRGFEPVALNALLRTRATGEPLAPRCFVVTFDDGYENFFTAARPILHAFHVPATVFLATAYLDSAEPFPFDDWAAAGSIFVPQDTWRPMTIRQCKELTRDPLIEIGAHTHTHQNFIRNPSGLRHDLHECLGFLQMQLSVTAPAFAFPFGLADPSLLEVVRRAGVCCALTAEEELIKPGSEPFGWGRFIADGCDTSATLAGCLGGWYSELRRHSLW